MSTETKAVFPLAPATGIAYCMADEGLEDGTEGMPFIMANREDALKLLVGGDSDLSIEFDAASLLSAAAVALVLDPLAPFRRAGFEGGFTAIGTFGIVFGDTEFELNCGLDRVELPSPTLSVDSPSRDEALQTALLMGTIIGGLSEGSFSVILLDLPIALLLREEGISSGSTAVAVVDMAAESGLADP